MMVDENKMVQICLGGLTEVQVNPDGNMHTGEATVHLWLAIDVDGQRKPRKWVKDRSIRKLDVVHEGGKEV